jgi:hypothetical protein
MQDYPTKRHLSDPKTGKFISMSPDQKFWPKIDKTATCWIWKGGRTAQGYGIFKQDKKPILAHRFSYEIHKGKIPIGMVMCHHCDNPSCVNPEHLFYGTPKDNRQDSLRKNRQARGEKQGAHKLTEEQVKKIRAIYKWHNSQLGLRSLGETFGIHLSTIQRIIKRRTWRHI